MCVCVCVPRRLPRNPALPVPTSPEPLRLLPPLSQLPASCHCAASTPILSPRSSADVTSTYREFQARPTCFSLWLDGDGVQLKALTDQQRWTVTKRLVILPLRTPTVLQGCGRSKARRGLGRPQHRSGLLYPATQPRMLQVLGPILSEPAYKLQDNHGQPRTPLPLIPPCAETQSCPSPSPSWECVNISQPSLARPIVGQVAVIVVSGHWILQLSWRWWQ